MTDTELKILKMKIDAYGIQLGLQTQDTIDILIAKMMCYNTLVSSGVSLTSSNIDTTITNELDTAYASLISDYFDLYEYALLRNKLLTNSLRLVSYSNTEITDFYKLLTSGKTDTNFEITNFKLTTYKIASVVDINLNSKLLYIHNHVFVPIIKYYINKYGISESDLIIHTAQYKIDAIIMKEVTFKINNVSNIEILSDIRQGKIAIKYEDAGIKDKYVWIRNAPIRQIKNNTVVKIISARSAEILLNVNSLDVQVV